MGKVIYFDNAAATLVRPGVVNEINKSLHIHYGNPSSTHLVGRQSKVQIEKARKTIAKLMNAHPGEIIFTSGGTEADNMILRGCVENMGVESIITSKIEHHAVLSTVKKLQQNGTELHFVNVLHNGDIDLDHLEKLLNRDSKKKLVSLMHVNNEIGNITDMSAISKLCKRYGALFHSDTVQSVGHLEWDTKVSEVDFLIASAHKFHGPKGIGFAYIRKGVPPGSFITGGGQERGLRAGTESVHNIVGLETAMVEAYENLNEERECIKNLKAYFKEQLQKNFKVRFNGLSGDTDKSTHTILNVCFEDISERNALMFQFHLDINGIACSRGSACQSGSAGGSHVLKEILSEDLINKPSLRFSFSHLNKIEEVDETISVIREFMTD